jgi:UTP--glucose-1-phosphate uridylyltransferase
LKRESNNEKVRKAVFPVAGMGTRFLPATKASPKEMLPIVDKPLIQYAVEEAVAAGITDMVFVTGRSKRAIEDHFDKAYELESELEARGKSELLEFVRTMIPKDINCIYIRQAEALGLGHAVLCAKPVIGDEPFAVILADDLLDGKPPVMKQMTDILTTTVAPFSASRTCPVLTPRATASSTHVGSRIDWNRSTPSSKTETRRCTVHAGSCRALHPDAAYFPSPGKRQTGRRGEIQLTDGIASLLSEEQVLAHRYDGVRYDCGSKLGYLQATVVFGQRHHEVGPAFNEYLKTLVA